MLHLLERYTLFMIGPLKKHKNFFEHSSKVVIQIPYFANRTIRKCSNSIRIFEQRCDSSFTIRMPPKIVFEYSSKAEIRMKLCKNLNV